jgi:hypothetical protein
MHFSSSPCVLWKAFVCPTLWKIFHTKPLRELVSSCYFYWLRSAGQHRLTETEILIFNIQCFNKRPKSLDYKCVKETNLFYFLIITPDIQIMTPAAAQEIKILPPVMTPPRNIVISSSHNNICKEQELWLLHLLAIINDAIQFTFEKQGRAKYEIY